MSLLLPLAIGALKLLTALSLVLQTRLQRKIILEIEIRE
jgi:hypothetical protein